MLKIILIAFFVMLPFSIHASEAEQPKIISIAVVDVQQLMNESKAAKSIQSQGKSLRKKYQKNIDKLEDDLKSAEKKVIDAGKEKDQEKFVKSRAEFQKELVSSKKKLNEMNSKLDKSIATALNKLRDEIVEIVDDITREKKYDIVITRADIITVARDIDITADVMKILNKKTPKITVKD